MASLAKQSDNPKINDQIVSIQIPKMKKTILIVTDNLADQINGVVTTYKNIESYAIKENYNVAYLDPGRFHYFDSPGYKEVKFSIPWGIGQIIEEINPDYIHITTEGPIGLCAKLYLDKKGYSYNSAYHTKFPEGLKKLFGIPEDFTWPLVRWFHKHSSNVLSTTQSMVDQLKAHGMTGKLVPWTRGVDRNIFSPSLRKKQDGQKITLLCVSRISKEKDLERFFSLQYPNSHKIMVGDGPMRKKYESAYSDVEFVGFKTGKELASYYANADVFVMPSTWETFGIVMIEAMACGTPVAAYPCQGPKDVVENGVTGYLSDDLKQAIDQCLGLDRNNVFSGSQKWSWEQAWEIFRNNLVKMHT